MTINILEANVDVFLKFIKEKADENPGLGINPAWVEWAIRTLAGATEMRAMVNPEWLRIPPSGWLAGDNEPPMFLKS